MKLTKIRIQNYRSVEDSGEFEIGDLTCLVGKNEAGKTALLNAIRCLRRQIRNAWQVGSGKTTKAVLLIKHATCLTCFPHPPTIRARACVGTSYQAANFRVYLTRRCCRSFEKILCLVSILYHRCTLAAQKCHNYNYTQYCSRGNVVPCSRIV